MGPGGCRQPSHRQDRPREGPTRGALSRTVRIPGRPVPVDARAHLSRTWRVDEVHPGPVDSLVL